MFALLCLYHYTPPISTNCDLRYGLPGENKKISCTRMFQEKISCGVHEMKKKIEQCQKDATPSPIKNQIVRP